MFSKKFVSSRIGAAATLLIVAATFAVFQPALAASPQDGRAMFAGSDVAAAPQHALKKNWRGQPKGGCTDNDGDGYGVGTCLGPDCNDNDASINPGASELCGDGIDNNCSAGVDEGFENLGDVCIFATDPGGCSVGDAGGCCATSSSLVCSANLLSLVCATPAQPIVMQQAEGPSGSASCFDFVDNNCDGVTDHQDPVCQTAELCNSFDDDGDFSIDEDFISLGGPCTVGTGACMRPGAFICAADQLGTACTATAGPPGIESLAAGGSCFDGIDNDCDGVTDAGEADCLQAELCDGVDNDGDGFVDEDFASLGDGCAVGQGVCQANGSQVCTANKLATMCNATAGLASAEGPVGPTCSDGLDNDCDGFADGADPGCASAALAVQCALPYLTGRPGTDCNGRHIIQYNVSGATDDTVVFAELIGYDVDGGVLATLPVNLGDQAHLRSRTNQLKFMSFRNRHSMFAPNPVLHVVASDSQASADAYCSIVPYLDVLQPAGNVVSVSEGDVTNVLAALPLTDPGTLIVKVDGVDILAGLGIDPTVDFPGGPFSGVVVIDGENVEVEDLIVSIGELIPPGGPGGSGPLGDLSSNTLTMRLRNLGGGGHIVLVESDAVNDIPGFVTADGCLRDDIKDTGTVSVFGIDIFTPGDGEVTLSVPTPVTGEVTHGREITALQINGLPVDVIGQVFSPGDGETSADEYLFAFNVALDQSDLRGDLNFGAEPLGTFDAGSNRLIADASDDLGNRTFADRIFAVGSVANPLSAAALAAMQDEIKAELTPTLMQMMSKVATEIDNAFVVGLEADGLQRLFDEKCAAAGVEFKTAVTAEILAKVLPSKVVGGGCSCDPRVYFNITSVAIDETDVSCPVNFMNDQMDVAMNLPDIVVTATARGSCRTTFLGACTSETIVDITSTTTIANLAVNFSISEAQFLGAAPAAPTFIEGDTTVNTAGGSDVNCLASFCNWALEGLAFLLTFGQADFDLSPQIDVTDVQSFNKEIGANEPDPVELGEIKIDEETVEEFGRAMFSGELSDVQITPAGLVAALGGTFDTQTVDPDIELTPGAFVGDPAPVPMLPQPESGDAFIVLADDVFNQLFASLTLSGGLKTSCQDTGKTVGDLFVGTSGTCEGLTGDTDQATAFAQGLCHGVFGDNCESLSGATDALTGAEQGACHGASGANCNTIPVVPGSGEFLTCTITPNLNLMASDKTLFCSRQDMPPRLLLSDNPLTEPVETALRLNDLSVFMVVDRGGDGLDSDLAATNNCFSADGSGAGDCSLFSVCLDLNLISEMSIVGASAACPPGVPGILTEVNSVQILSRQEGVVCGAGSQTDDALLAGIGAADDTINIIKDNAETFTPPLCAEGLNVGGLLQLQNPKMFTIETDGDPEFQDYIGITGNVVP